MNPFLSIHSSMGKMDLYTASSTKPSGGMQLSVFVNPPETYKLLQLEQLSTRPKSHPIAVGDIRRLQQAAYKSLE